MSRVVPDTLEDLVSGYDRFILWAIQRFTPRVLVEEDIQDLRQMVYLRIVEKDFLGRCRLYYDTHDGRFVTSLSALVRNVLYSFWKRRRTDVLAEARHVDDYQTLPDLFHFEGRIEAADELGKLAASLRSRRRLIPISTVFEAALVVGPSPLDIAEHLGMNPSTVRSHVAAARRVARRSDAFSSSAV